MTFSNAISWKKNSVVWFRILVKCVPNLTPYTMSPLVHAISQCLNQWWHGTPVHWCATRPRQATGLDAYASRVKCPARFVSHLHEIFIYIWVVYSFWFFLLFVHYCNVMVYVVYCVASGKQEKVQACLVTLWLFIISCHSLSKTTLGSLCSWKPAWSLKKRPYSMCLKPFVKMCIFVVIQIFWSLRKYREQ